MIDISSRYLIILIFRSFFSFFFFFYALASLLLFATREIISRFEREEYFSVRFLVKVVLVIVAILSLEYYSLLKLRLLGGGIGSNIGGNFVCTISIVFICIYYIRW